MTTKNYIKELYYFAYTLISFAEQDNVRATLWDYIEGNVSVDFFHDDICRALAVDTKAQYVLGVWYPNRFPLINTFLSQMTTTFQPDILNQTYNGWENYETWNVALWIQNDQGLYDIARLAGNYEDFVDALEACSFNALKTPDGVSFKDPKVNVLEINSDVFDFWP